MKQQIHLTISMKRPIQRLIAFILLLTISVGPLMTIQAGTTFKDVKGTEWFISDLTYMSESSRQIISGYPDGTFRPDTNLTVEQFIKSLVCGCGFNDQPTNPSDWSLPYRNQAVTMGILKSGDFANYKSAITREQMAMLAVRTAEFLQNTGTYRDKSKVQSLIFDYATITENKKDYVIKAYDMGILLGYPDNNYKPKNSLKRSEAIAVIRRVIETSARKMPDLEKVVADPADTVVIEGIKFSPSRDTMHEGSSSVYDGLIKMDKAVEFMQKYINSIKFTKESDGYYVSGYLPNLPEGMIWAATINVYYGGTVKGEYNDVDEFYTNRSATNIGRFYPGKNFKFKLKGGPSSLNPYGIIIYTAIVNDYYVTDGTITLTSWDKDYLINYYVRSEYITNFNWKGMFQW